MKKVLLGLSAVALVAFTSCETKEATEIKDAEEVAEASEHAAIYDVDPATSHVEWKGTKIYEGEEGGHNGTIKVSEGEIKLEDNKIVAGNFTIDVATLESMDLNESPEDKAKLDGHLKGDAFLDVEKFPTAKFDITKVESVEGEYNTEISGNLKIKDAEKNVTFKANVVNEGDKLKINSEEFVIDRKEFGINFDLAKGSILHDNVPLRVSVEANKAAEVEAEEVVVEEESAH